MQGRTGIARAAQENVIHPRQGKARSGEALGRGGGNGRGEAKHRRAEPRVTRDRLDRGGAARCLSRWLTRAAGLRDRRGRETR